MKQYFNNYFFFLTLSFCVVFFIGFSYYRFMVKHDYVVSYHGSCDPITGKCFMSCDDDACTKPDYYTEMQKYEPDLYKECGQDIINCDLANICLLIDRKCSVTYCNKSTSDKDNPCQTPIDVKTRVQADPINNSNNINI